MHKLPFKTKIITAEMSNEIFWFSRKKLYWASSNA
jgi:hypothetical protein